ncbi:MAG TPA: archease, partial [Methanocorpusculum sp.]|nr:archease [Methanocorpusculum sp.]
YLSELLFLVETEYLVPTDFKITIINNNITGIVTGVPFDKSKHSGGIEVKGISYSGISLKHIKSEYELIVIFDI